MFVINKIQNQISKEYDNAGKGKIFCGALNGIVSAELAIRAMGNLFSIIQNPSSYVLRETLSSRLALSIYYGISATNALPGLSIFSASILTLFSIFFGGESGVLTTAKMIYISNNFLHEHFIDPVLEFLLPKIESVLKALFSLINIPVGPEWGVVGLLICAIIIVKYGIPYLSSSVLDKN